jgi:hypothetical protein
MNPSHATTPENITIIGKMPLSNGHGPQKSQEECVASHPENTFLTPHQRSAASSHLYAYDRTLLYNLRYPDAYIWYGAIYALPASPLSR